jgi:hypothetical protein
MLCVKLVRVLLLVPHLLVEMDAPISANDEGGGVAQPRGAPQQYLDLRGWCGMPLEQFAGTGAPIEAADWLSTATKKLDAFRIPQIEWVRYATQLLKGEALVL